MTEEDDGAVALARLWPRDPHYSGGLVPVEPEMGFHSIEPKARQGDANDNLRLLLNDLTSEMRAQFTFFKRLRVAASKKARSDEDGQDADIRVAMKAATDAIASIIRTLEKADELQRRLAAARQVEEERKFDSKDYANAKAHFLDLIEKRAEDIARQRARANAGQQGAE